MQEMVQKLFESIDKLRECIDARYEISQQRANAEYKYREMLGREMAAAKADGMAATSLYNYCRGLEHVAKLREERELLIAQEQYLDDLIYYYRQVISIYQKQAEAERNGL
jgi:hypothetical protein